MLRLAPPAIYSSLAAPFTQVSGLEATAEADGTITFEWDLGDNEKTVVFFKATSTNGTTVPTDNTTYTANTIFGSGTQLGTGYYCVYNSTGTLVVITGLTPSATYDVIAFGYNGNAGFESYLTDLTVGGNQGIFTAFETPALPEGFTTISIAANKDASYIASSPTNNFDGTLLFVRGQAGVQSMHSIFNFSLATLPNNVNIISARLKLRIVGSGLFPPPGTMAAILRIFPELIPEWVENQVTWNIYKTGSAWATGGGDFVPADSVVLPITYDIGQNQIIGTNDVISGAALVDKINKNHNIAQLGNITLVITPSTPWPVNVSDKRYSSRTSVIAPILEIDYEEASTSPAVTSIRIPVSRISRMVRSR